MVKKAHIVTVWTAIFMLWLAPSVSAHGIWCHVHVTGWAIENLPDGELKSFFDEPEVFQAALFGAAFADSGYWPQTGELKAAASAYSEHNHWEPFIQSFVTWIRDNDPPPFETLESKKRAAFLMGIAAHGLQDELFDSLYLPKVEHHDKGSQDSADPASDGFLSEASLIRFLPTEYIPMETLLTLYKDITPPITEDVIRQSVDIMLAIYLNDEIGQEITQGLGEQHSETLPWTLATILDPEVPGSVVSEVFPTRGYLESVWRRLHGTSNPEDPSVFWYPDPPLRLMSNDHTLAESWVTVVYGIGVHRASANATWTRADGQEVAFETKGTRWNVAYGRMHRFMPKQALEPGAEYTLSIEPGLGRIDDTLTEKPLTLNFQVACNAPNDPKCPTLNGVRKPVLDGSTYTSNPDTPEDTPTVAEPQPKASQSSGCQSGPTPSSGTGVMLCLLLILGLRLAGPKPMLHRRQS